MANVISKLRLFLLLLVATLGLTGCSTQENVLSSLSENEANEIVALLRSNNIYATKAEVGKQVFAVRVPARNFPFAVQISYLWGYPKADNHKLGNLFVASGIVPTPMEERVKVITGITQELESTLSQIDGVNTVRVHLGLADTLQASPIDRITQIDDPKESFSQAAVFIEFDSNRVLLDTLLPRIRRLVSDSVPQLEPDQVAVLTQQETPFSAAPISSRLEAYYVWRVKIRFQDLSTLIIATVILVFFALALLIAIRFQVARSSRSSAQK